MKFPKKRKIIFHGAYKEKYYDQDLEIGADSMFALCNILFVEIFPDLKKEKHLNIVFESEDGTLTELFDPEQELHEEQTTVHIMPNPDGAFDPITAIIVAIVAIGVAMLLAPKMDNTSSTASGSNWETPENVVGQGGVLPVALGKRLIGSRVASYGIDSIVYQGRDTYA